MKAWRIGAACLVGALLAAAPGRLQASFAFPLRGGRPRAPRIDDAPAAAGIPGMSPAFRTFDGASRTVFARYASGLHPEAALAEASAAMLNAGWRRVHSSPSLAVFENRAGSIAVVMAMPANAANGTTLSLLVQL